MTTPIPEANHPSWEEFQKWAAETRFVTSLDNWRMIEIAFQKGWEAHRDLNAWGGRIDRTT